VKVFIQDVPADLLIDAFDFLWVEGGDLWI
jgi:hypothetical protein